MSKTTKTFSLDVELAKALDVFAAQTGQKLSAIVEQGIRSALALPPPEKEDEDTLGHTRSEKAILETLTKAAPGWHRTIPLGQKTGLSRVVAEKALRGLERAGKVFCWGAGLENFDGTFDLAWGLTSPVDVVRQLIARWKAAGGTSHKEGSVGLVEMVQGVCRLARQVDDIEPIRALVRDATGYEDDQLGIYNLREITAQRNEIERQRVRDGV